MVAINGLWKVIVKILIELESLIDTRIGVMRTKFPNEVCNLDTNAYINRELDCIPGLLGVSVADWSAAWNSRDNYTLANSIYTDMFKRFAFVIGGTIYSALSDPTTGKISLTINTYPYQLSDYEKECIKDSILDQLWCMIDIDVVYLEPCLITTAYLRNNDYLVYVLYDYKAWGEATLTELDKCPYPELKIYYPKIAQSLTHEELTNIQRSNVDLFEQHRREFIAFYSAEAVEVSSMCFLPELKEEELPK